MNTELQRIYDALLVVRYQSGDDSALDELVRRHETQVKTAVMRWLGTSTSAVDDVCQQVWIAVIKGIPKINQPMTWQAWLNRIVHAEVALFLRKRDRRTLPLDSVCDPQVVIPDEPFVCWEKLRSAIKALGEPYESMLQMRFWDSLSYQQIADTLGIPIGTVRSRLHWARSQLAKQLCMEIH